jgi:hypothetical protein
MTIVLAIDYVFRKDEIDSESDRESISPTLIHPLRILNKNVVLAIILRVTLSSMPHPPRDMMFVEHRFQNC